jgi:hypothetical protein
MWILWYCLLLAIATPSVDSFLIAIHQTKPWPDGRLSQLIRCSNRNDNNNNSSNNGYKLGDFTRGAVNRFQNRVNSLTGKNSYRFGDLSRWLDTQAKEKVERFTNKPDYQFGDISKEIVRRLLKGEYSRDDLLLLLKIVATIGINFQPVAHVLPIKVLIDLLNLSLEASIAQTLGNKVIVVITHEIDGRMKEMVTGNRDYQMGDYTKRIIGRWTGRESYEFGDVTRTILGRLEARDGIKSQSEEANVVVTAYSQIKDEQSIRKDIVLELDKTERDALEAWDEEFLIYQRETQGLAVMKDTDIYRDWDEKYLTSEKQNLDSNSHRK